MQTLYRTTKEDVAVGDFRWVWTGVSWNGPEFTPISAVEIDGAYLLVDGLRLTAGDILSNADISMRGFSTEGSSGEPPGVPPQAQLATLLAWIGSSNPNMLNPTQIRKDIAGLSVTDFILPWIVDHWNITPSPDQITSISKSADTALIGTKNGYWFVCVESDGLHTGQPFPTQEGRTWTWAQFTNGDYDHALAYYEALTEPAVPSVTYGFSCQVPDTPDISPTGDPGTTVKTSIAPDDSMLRRLVTSMCTPGLLLSEQQISAGRNSFLHSYLTSDDPRLWIINLPASIGTTKFIEVNGIQIRRAQSLWEFWNTSDAVWILGAIARTDTDTPASTDIYLRNLDVVEVTVRVTGTTVAVAPNTDVLDDSPVWYRIPEQMNAYLVESARWCKIDHPDLVLDDGSICVQLPFGEEVTDLRLRYRSAAAKASIAASSLAKVDFYTYTLREVSRWTQIDELASLLGVERAGIETSLDLHTRAKGIAAAGYLNNSDAVVRLGNLIGLVSVLDWYPGDSPTLALPAGCTAVRVIDLPEVVSFRESPVRCLKTDNYVLRSKRTIEPPYNVSVLGKYVETPTITNGEFTYHTDRPSSLVVSYRARNYTLTSSGGYYTQVTANTDNISASHYCVVAVTGLTIEQTSTVIERDPEFLSILLAATDPVLHRLAYWDDTRDWPRDGDVTAAQDTTVIRMS